MSTISEQLKLPPRHLDVSSGTIEYVEPSEAGVVSNRPCGRRWRKPRYPAIFYLPQAFEAHGPKPVPVAPEGTPRCSSVARSEKGLGGSRAGWGGVRPESPSAVSEKSTTVGLTCQRRSQTQLRRSRRTGSGRTSRQAPTRPTMGSQRMRPFMVLPLLLRCHQAAGMRAITKVSPGSPFPVNCPGRELWEARRLPFPRSGIAIGAIGLATVMVAVWLFLSSPKWQFAVVLGCSFAIATFAFLQAGLAIGSYRRASGSAAGRVSPISTPPAG